MAWCEASDVDFIFGLAKNVRLTRDRGENWSRPATRGG
jgi:hypothetical protein